MLKCANHQVYHLVHMCVSIFSQNIFKGVSTPLDLSLLRFSHMESCLSSFSIPTPSVALPPKPGQITRYPIPELELPQTPTRELPVPDLPNYNFG